MIDGNKIRLNGDTMKTAVEYWLNQEVLQNDVKVADVTYLANVYVFEVEIADKVGVK